LTRQLTSHKPLQINTKVSNNKFFKNYLTFFVFSTTKLTIRVISCTQLQYFENMTCTKLHKIKFFRKKLSKMNRFSDWEI
jgi:hypothetical protein